MEEQITLPKTAKSAKEKGFDWKVINHYKGDELIYNGSLYNYNDSKEQELWNIELTSAPTQSLLQKWLREKHNLNIGMTYFNVTKPIMDSSYWEFRIHYHNVYGQEKTYEESLEVALFVALNLI